MNPDLAARQLGSLGSPQRLRIYHLLVRAGPDGLSCGALADKTGLPASTLSHHIRYLKEADLVFQNRHATSLVCHANYAAMNSLICYLSDSCRPCAESRGRRKATLVPGKAAFFT